MKLPSSTYTLTKISNVDDYILRGKSDNTSILYSQTVHIASQRLSKQSPQTVWSTGAHTVHKGISIANYVTAITGLDNLIFRLSMTICHHVLLLY